MAHHLSSLYEEPSLTPPSDRSPPTISERPTPYPSLIWIEFCSLPLADLDWSGRFGLSSLSLLLGSYSWFFVLNPRGPPTPVSLGQKGIYFPLRLLRNDFRRMESSFAVFSNSRSVKARFARRFISVLLPPLTSTTRLLMKSRFCCLYKYKVSFF